MVEMKKYLWSLTRVAIPVLGLMMCILAYMMTLKIEYAHLASPVYILIVFGFLAMLLGFFWNICHSMKTKLYQRGRCEQSIHVFAIERPSCFPPSYEESQGSQVPPDRASEVVVTVDGVDMVMSLAPPLYSQNSSEDSDCTWNWEQPPRYSQVQHTQLAAEGGHV